MNECSVYCIYDDRVTNPVKVGLMRFKRDECSQVKSLTARVTRDGRANYRLYRTK